MLYPKLVVVGDFNIVPNESDAYEYSPDSILCSLDERKALKRIYNLGLNDCFAPISGESPYTWWDYRGGAFHRDIGYRIDLILSSNTLNKKVTNFIEIGPGKVLSGLVKRIDKNVKITTINNIEDLKNLDDKF